MTTLAEMVAEVVQLHPCAVCKQGLGGGFHAGMPTRGPHHRHCCTTPDSPACSYLEGLFLAAERSESRLPPTPERAWIDVGGEGGV